MPYELNVAEVKLLVELARNAVKEYLKTGECIKAPESTPEKLFEKYGVFVTISKLKNGEKQLLRGTFRGFNTLTCLEIFLNRVSCKFN